MRLLFDINVLLDVFRRREPFYSASAEALTKVAEHEEIGCLPCHALTTLYYLIRRDTGRQQAGEVVDWLLVHFEIIPQDKLLFSRARTLEILDFEDSALAAAAEAARCDLILTRNVTDFLKSPVQAMTPLEFLAQRGIILPAS
jgi:predicted nucleic acid-binding protein